jgi:hypothetical protein
MIAALPVVAACSRAQRELQHAWVNLCALGDQAMILPEFKKLALDDVVALRANLDLIEARLRGTVHVHGAAAAIEHVTGLAA